MVFRAVLFDMDGTLIESDEAIARAWVKTFARNGLTLPAKNEILKGSGLSGEDWAKKLLKQYAPDSDALKDPEKLKKLASEFRHAYDHFTFPILARVDPKALPLLTALKKENIKLALSSNADKELVDRLVKALGFYGLFDAVISGEKVKKPKPAPDVITAALDELKVKPEEALYVGDTQVDVKACQAAGCRVAIRFHERNKHVTGADYHIHSLDEVLTLVQKSQPKEERV